MHQEVCWTRFKYWESINYVIGVSLSYCDQALKNAQFDYSMSIGNKATRATLK